MGVGLQKILNPPLQCFFKIFHVTPSLQPNFLHFPYNHVYISLMTLSHCFFKINVKLTPLPILLLYQQTTIQKMSKMSFSQLPYLVYTIITKLVDSFQIILSESYQTNQAIESRAVPLHCDPSGLV